MSKIARKPLILPPGVTVQITGQQLSVTGPKGKLEMDFLPVVKVEASDGKVKTSVIDSSDRRQKALWGTTHALIRNIVKGVSEGYQKKLEVVGVGYRVAADKNKINLSLGYSHPIQLPVPAGLEVKVEKMLITISGVDKQLVGQFAATIRDQRPPEPYKGKGIKYSDEVIRRKAGKVVKASGG